MSANPNPRLTVLADEFTRLRGEVDAFDQAAADEQRDLTDDERTSYDAALTRMEAIDADVKAINQRADRFAAAAEATTRALPGVTGSPAHTAPRVVIPSHGEQVALLRSIAHGDEDAKTRWDAMNEGAILGRALDHGVAADGVSPTTIEGDLIQFVDSIRYAVNASRRLPLPDNKAKTFERPKVTVNTSVDEQAAEGDVLSSTALEVDSVTVTKKTYGGVVAISEQEEDWTDPAMLGLIPTNLAEMYAIKTDDVLCTALESAVTSNKTVLSNTAALDVFIAAVASASVAVYTASKKLPDTLFVAPDRWAYIISLTDDDGRPAFPIANVVNSAGMNTPGVRSFGGLNVLGLNVVTDPNFASGTWQVAASQLVESYEQVKGQLQIAAPSTLETIIAYRGYFATKVWTEGINGFKTS